MPFHGGNTGSNPVGDANYLNEMETRSADDDDRDKPPPVVLDLVQPAVVLRRLGARGDDPEADIPRHAGQDRCAGQGKYRHGRGGISTLPDAKPTNLYAAGTAASGNGCRPINDWEGRESGDQETVAGASRGDVVAPENEPARAGGNGSRSVRYQQGEEQ